MLLDQNQRDVIGKRAQEYVLLHRGAADRTVKMLFESLVDINKPTPLDRAA